MLSVSLHTTTPFKVFCNFSFHHIVHVQTTNWNIFHKIAQTSNFQNSKPFLCEPRGICSKVSLEQLQFSEKEDIFLHMPGKDQTSRCYLYSTHPQKASHARIEVLTREPFLLLGNRSRH